GENVTWRELTPFTVTAVAISSDEARIAIGGSDGQIQVRDLGTHELLHTFESDGSVGRLCFAGDHLIAACGSVVHLLAVDAGVRRRTLEAHRAEVCGLAVSPDGTRFASSSRDRTVVVWALDGTLLRTERGHRHSVRALQFSPDGRRLLSLSSDGVLKTWRGGSDLLLAHAVTHNTSVMAISALESDRRFASIARGGRLRFWDEDTHRQQGAVDAYALWATCMTWSEPASRLVIGSVYSPLAVIDPASPRVVEHLESDGEITDVAAHPDLPLVAAVSRKSREVSLWNLSTGSVQQSIPQAAARCVEFSPDGECLAIGGRGFVGLWPVGATEPLWMDAIEDFGEATQVAFSPDGRTIVFGNDDRLARSWRVSDGRRLSSFEGHEGRIHAIDFVRDSTRVVTGSEDGTVRLWEADSGRLLLSAREFPSPVRAVRYSSSSDTIIVGCDDGSVHTIDASPPTLDREIDGDRLAVELRRHEIATRYLAEYGTLADAVAAIEREPGIDSAEREGWIATAELLGENWAQQRALCWAILQDPEPTAEQRSRALVCGDALARVSPSLEEFRLVRGIAQYRFGSLDDARADLEAAAAFARGKPRGPITGMSRLMEAVVNEDRQAVLEELRWFRENPMALEDPRAAMVRAARRSAEAFLSRDTPETVDPEPAPESPGDADPATRAGR
ncbi:MAG: PD40 domain-containing protein, partial [Planctomycetes bacterium]|nr:PD40 domain-containing protein [Planctomycetota bacterium]